MTDYTNTLSISSIPSYIKWAITLLIILNIVLYKKFKISRYIEEYFPNYSFTYGSLGFLVFITITFATYGADTFIEVFCIVLGFFMSLSYLTSVYKDATDKKIGKKWFSIFGIILVDCILFQLIENKMILYILCLIQNALCMIYETRKITKQ